MGKVVSFCICSLLVLLFSLICLLDVDSLRLNSKASRKVGTQDLKLVKAQCICMKIYQANLVLLINVFLTSSEHSFSLSATRSKNTQLMNRCPLRSKCYDKDRISATIPSIQETRVSMVMVSSFTEHCTVVQRGECQS